VLATIKGAAVARSSRTQNKSLVDIDRFSHENLVTSRPAGPSDGSRASGQHLARDIARFGRRFHEVHAALNPLAKVPFRVLRHAPALSRPDRRAEFARDLFRFLGGLSHPTARAWQRQISAAILSPDIRERSCSQWARSAAISSRKAGQQTDFSASRARSYLLAMESSGRLKPKQHQSS
jgi:hypothetical protein